MKIISRNKQKDTRPFAGILALKQIILFPLSIFVVIAFIANVTIQSAM